MIPDEGVDVAVHDFLDDIARIGDAATWEQITAAIDDDYLAQMESEHRIKKNGKWLWDWIGSRGNHYWDAECFQVVAAFMLKLVGREASAPVDTPDGEP